MLARLPELIDPLLLADRNASIIGELPISTFDRMAETLFDDVGNVSIKLFFHREGKLAKIEGHISTVLALKCQRCLEAVEWPVNSNINLGIVSSLEQANNLPDGYEPLLLIDDDKIPLKDIVEDELLLSLPTIPKHENDCYAHNLTNNKIESLAKTAQKPKDNPFSILADLNKLETHNGSTKK